MKNTVKISKTGNSKLGGHIGTVSLTPIKSCGNCEHCKSDCYALNFMKRNKDTVPRYAINLDHARRDVVDYFDCIIGQIERMRKPLTFFRWHIAGDIISQEYVDGMYRTARRFPDIKFLCFTKMFGFDYSRKPKNLSIVFSAWPKMNITRKRGIRIAWMDDGTDARIPKNALECFGNCEACGLCWHLSELKKDVVFHKHL